jgi:uncharacterized radical SAM superfamily Fe-S cluster-containing enzyme
MTKIIDLKNLDYYELEPEDNIFTDIFVDVTHRCNMECKNCYLPNRLPPDMQLEKFKEFIKRVPVGPNHAQRMFRIIGAEPTLHKDCIEFIRTVLDAGHMCILITNGLRLSSESFVQKLVDVGLTHLYMSMNGVDRDDWYTAIDDMPCATKKLKALKNVANKFSLDLGTILVKGVNDEAPTRMMNLIKELDIKNVTLRFKNVGQIGRYMEGEDQNWKMEDLVRITAKQFNLPEKYIWDFYKINHRYAGAPEICGIEYPVDTTHDPKFRYKGIWVKLTDWDTENEKGIPDPGSVRRGRITPDWKLAPFYEHVKLNENGY